MVAIVEVVEQSMTDKIVRTCDDYQPLRHQHMGWSVSDDHAGDIVYEIQTQVLRGSILPVEQLSEAIW